ncbi:membrane protein insertase YidC [Pontibacillus yanchengensis]|uniref:Membrane protein insertase YidC n=1 Tax=Pontibacillus yanchengensis Y32 TaxID=1385514 RepID=A0A0A2TAE7_9BACI|nr:membrane protein insertase YidC [Pontibacillus yanchengensis]KGP71358.1 OxaA-like protein precursor [Pontibacillus yanchengensis Y32]
MKKTWQLILLFLVSTFLLAGCSTQSGEGDGFFNQFFVQPFSIAIQTLAEWFSGSYGVAIIVVTLIIRLILMPLMLNMYKKQQLMKTKMTAIKPEMDDVQNRLKEATSQEDKQQIQNEMMELYQKHGVNPLNMGCLPLLLQMPILMGFYYAIRSSEEIATHTFMWFDLGQPDISMAIIAGILYFIQYKVSLIGVPDEQKKQMKIMGLLSPVMILVISLTAPAALPLYWAVGGAFLILQTWIGRKLYSQSEEEAS